MTWSWTVIIYCCIKYCSIKLCFKSYKPYKRQRPYEAKTMWGFLTNNEWSIQAEGLHVPRSHLHNRLCSKQHVCYCAHVWRSGTKPSSLAASYSTFHENSSCHVSFSSHCRPSDIDTSLTGEHPPKLSACLSLLLVQLWPQRLSWLTWLFYLSDSRLFLK